MGNTQNVTLAVRWRREGYRLALISAAIVLAIQVAGAVTLWQHTSDAPAVLGRYSQRYFALIVAYHGAVIGWVIVTALILASLGLTRSGGLFATVQRIFTEAMLTPFALVLIWAWAPLFVRIAEKEAAAELAVQLGIILAVAHTTLLWLAVRHRDWLPVDLIEALPGRLQSLWEATPGRGLVIALGLVAAFALPFMIYGLTVLFGEDSQYRFTRGVGWSLLGMIILTLMAIRMAWQDVRSLVMKIYVAMGMVLILLALWFSVSSQLPEEMRRRLSDPTDNSLEALVAERNLINYPVYQYMFENLRGATLFTAYRDLLPINLEPKHTVRYSDIVIQQTHYRDFLTEREAARLTALSQDTVSAHGREFIFVIGDEKPSSLYLLQRYNRVFIVAPAYLPDMIPAPHATGELAR